MIKYVSGDIFNSDCQTLVNPVNCVGVMGAGLAWQFAERYPKLEREYRCICRNKLLTIDKLWICRYSGKWVLCFPTKRHWRAPSKLKYIEAGLRNLVKTYKTRGITSIAFPKLGCGLGGLDWNDVRALMERYLGPIELDVQIYAEGPGEEE